MFSQRNNPYCELLSGYKDIKTNNMSKTILGLDLGTNSIGWALIQQDFQNNKGSILGMGSRIIPMPQDIFGRFRQGEFRIADGRTNRLPRSEEIA